MDNKKVWFVTGASKGLGLQLVRQLVRDGHQVAATSRNTRALTEAIGSHNGSQTYRNSTYMLPLLRPAPFGPAS